jgi:PfaD family protein
MTKTTCARPASTLAPPLLSIGQWSGDPDTLATDAVEIGQAVHDLHRPVYLVERDGALAVSRSGTATLGAHGRFPLVGFAPAFSLAQLGDPAWIVDHCTRVAYMTGSMAGGIASTDLVESAARAGMLASFGAAGLSIRRVEAAIDRLTESIGELPFAVNLIHSPNEPAHETAVVDLYLRRGVRLVDASAYLDLTLPVVRYRTAGIERDASGNVVAPHRIIAKASRVEVAAKWFSPPPQKLLSALVATGEISAEQAQMAREIPMAQDLTAEADSGGHTDNRPAITLIPTMIALRDRLQQQHGYAARLRVGAAGGIATPASAAAAFAMGASYIVTGSINQACVESGTSDAVREMLAAAEQADVIMAPAADMFEMGVKLQVLRRGTMFAMRAAKLYEFYQRYPSLDELSSADRETIEKTFFRASCETVWEETRRYFLDRDAAQVERAERDPKHRMALVFRWYLGMSSRWANTGETARRLDYQVWCGPAMGAFNEWTKGTPLAPPANRRVADVGLNVLYGAAVLARLSTLATQGVPLADEWWHVTPRSVTQLREVVAL